MRRAVFLDRDGTLIEESGYLDRLERLEFFPFTVDAVRVLNRAGFATVIITNQGGIARGIVRESFVSEAHRHIADRVEAGGAKIHALFYFPHHPPGGLEPYRTARDCPKPPPALLRPAPQHPAPALAPPLLVGGS